MVRTLIVAAIGFAAASLLYGSRGPDTGATISALRPRRHGARDAVVLAGAQICRCPAAGAFDVTCGPYDMVQGGQRSVSDVPTIYHRSRAA